MILFSCGLLVAALGAVVIIGCIGGLFTRARAATADERSIGNSAVEIDEIVDNVDNCAQITKLYDVLGGKTGTTYNQIKTLAQQTQNATDIMANNANQMLRVTFGGYIWHAVYLSTATDGRPILTLWMVGPYTTSVWNQQTAGYGDAYNVYPGDMYGTSYVRTKILNNAGGYSTDYGKTLNNTVTPSSTHPLARFSVDGVGNSLTQFIVKPSQVAWQRAGQNATKYGRPYNLKNENWGEEPTTNWQTNFWDDAHPDTYSNNYSRIANYGAWQNDYLWLPSVTEHYYLWNMMSGYAGDTSVLNWWYNQREYSGFWTRSGTANYHNYVGVHAYNVHENWVYDEREIRPALHLDLAALNDSIEHYYRCTF
ncbi:MAG: hypothetical protein NC133_03345, partial [Prevotella sp.]|nr:hypothetical protein [Prevotella sp.]